MTLLKNERKCKNNNDGQINDLMKGSDLSMYVILGNF